MRKEVLFLVLVILAGCSNPPAANKTNIRTKVPVKSRAQAPAPEANPWTINSFAAEEGQTEARKYVRFAAEGDFSDSTNTKGYLYAELLVDKIHAGIFLHKLKKSSPQEKLSEPVQIKMTNSSGVELNMTSTRRWNSSGGILIERNNNDYTQLRIFLLQNKGIVTVEIRDSGAGVYNFRINLDGFSESFSKL